MRIENRLQLQLWREECKEKHQKEKCRILVCGGTGCLAGGSDKIYARFKEMSEGLWIMSRLKSEKRLHIRE